MYTASIRSFDRVDCRRWSLTIHTGTFRFSNSIFPKFKHPIRESSHYLMIGLPAAKFRANFRELSGTEEIKFSYSADGSIRNNSVATRTRRCGKNRSCAHFQHSFHSAHQTANHHASRRRELFRTRSALGPHLCGSKLAKSGHSTLARHF